MRYLEIRSETPGGATCALLSESYTKYNFNNYAGW